MILAPEVDQGIIGEDFRVCSLPSRVDSTDEVTSWSQTSTKGCCPSPSVAILQGLSVLLE